MTTAEHVDVLIIGAGLSGIGAAAHLTKDLPATSYAVLERREVSGGTWDLFRYPGVRSDSDMHTLGYRFRPWRGDTALADGATTTPPALAERTGTAPRYVAEWLLAMATSGYVEHRGDDRYGLSPEQVACFTDLDSPAYVVGGFQVQSAGVRAADRLVEAFRSGAGMGWHEHHADLFEGTERFFRPGYLAHLPRIEGYLTRNLAHPALAALRDWHAAHLPGLVTPAPES